MEVSGKQEHVSILMCLQCDRISLKEPAYGYCKSCQEHLCQTCYNNHRKSNPFKQHVLLDQDAMSRAQKSEPNTSADAKDICENHPDKPLEFYCNTHKCVACYVCVTLEHKECNADFIPDVSRNMSDNMNSTFEWIESLIKTCKSNIDDSDRVMENMDKSYDEVVGDVKLFRKEINEHLDLMEATIISEADVLKQNVQRKQEEIKTTCEDIIEELTYLLSLFDKLNKGNKQNKLFIELKHAEKRMSILTDEEKTPIVMNRVCDGFRYTRNISLLRKLKTENKYGQLSAYNLPTADRKIDFQYTGTISLKSQADKEKWKCEIPGVAMIAPLIMVVADHCNKSIKMIDVKKGSVESEMEMSSSPVDVITIPDNKLAVTLRDEQCIQIVSYTTTEFSLCQRITVGETCNGVAYYQDKFVVCCQKTKKIMIINCDGEILNVFGTSDILYGPLRVVIDNNKKFMYVSDTDWRRKSKVVKIDWEGNVCNVFEDKSLTVPYGMHQLEDGTLLVCYRDSDTVVRLSNSLEKCEIVGLEITDIEQPRALTYINRDNVYTMFVVCKSKGWVYRGDVVKVFNVKWV